MSKPTTITNLFFHAYRNLIPLVIAHECGEEFGAQVLDAVDLPSEKGLWIATAGWHKDGGWIFLGWRRLTIQELAQVENGTWRPVYDPGST